MILIETDREQQLLCLNLLWYYAALNSLYSY